MPAELRKKTVVTIQNCAQCPFYERGLGTLIADLVAKRKQHTGMCKFFAGTQAFPFGRFHIMDATEKPPERCPMNDGDVVLELARG